MKTKGYRWNKKGGVIVTCGARLPRIHLLSGLDSNMIYFEEGAKFYYAFNWNDTSFIPRYPYINDISRGQAVDTTYLGSNQIRYVADHPGNITKLLLHIRGSEKCIHASETTNFSIANFVLLFSAVQGCHL
jgi:hypothetical protein